MLSGGYHDAIETLCYLFYVTDAMQHGHLTSPKLSHTRLIRVVTAYTMILTLSSLLPPYKRSSSIILGNASARCNNNNRFVRNLETTARYMLCEIQPMCLALDDKHIASIQSTIFVLGIDVRPPRVARLPPFGSFQLQVRVHVRRQP